MVQSIESSAAKSCPICGKPALQRFRPFCSSRCADIDLGRWLKGSYVIPGETAEEEENAWPEKQAPEDEE